MDKCLSKLGEGDYLTLANINNLALKYTNHGGNLQLVKGTKKRGRDYLKKALELHTKALEVSKILYGENSLRVLTSMHNLAITYEKLDFDQRALELCEQVIEKRSQLLGENHPETLMTKANLAYLYKKMGKHREALSRYLLVFEERKKVLGEYHKDTYETLRELIMLETIKLSRNPESLDTEELDRLKTHLLQAIATEAHLYDAESPVINSYRRSLEAIETLPRSRASTGGL